MIKMSSARDKLCRKLKQYILYGGLEEDQYTAIAPDIRDYNRQILTILTTALLLFVMLQLLATFFSSTLAHNRSLYVLALAILSIFNLVSTTKVMDSQLGVKVYMYCIITGSYAYAIAMSVNNMIVKDIPAVTFVCLLVAMPVLFTDAAWRMGLVTLLSGVVFLRFSYTFNSYDVFRINHINVFGFTALSCVLTMIVSCNNCSRMAGNRMLKEEHVQEEERQNNMIEALADIIESRDADTGGHIERTGVYMEKLLSELSVQPAYRDLMTEEFTKAVIEATPLHDVGKIKISDTILNKPAKLTGEEFEVMKRHTEYGADILERTIGRFCTPYYQHIAHNIALYHHERWDGAGYPSGMKGTEIPLEARLMSIVDVYDALTSPRCYKKAFTKEHAIAIIEDGRGTQFDPELTDIFLHLVNPGSHAA